MFEQTLKNFLRGNKNLAFCASLLNVSVNDIKVLASTRLFKEYYYFYFYIFIHCLNKQLSIKVILYNLNAACFLHENKST